MQDSNNPDIGIRIEKYLDNVNNLIEIRLLECMYNVRNEKKRELQSIKMDFLRSGETLCTKLTALRDFHRISCMLPIVNMC